MAKLFAIAAHPTFGESIGFLISGFTIVLMTLLVLALVTGAVGKLFLLIPAKAPAEARPPAATLATRDQDEDERVLAAITAAVHTVIKEPVRITKVVTSQGDTAWSREGRRRIQESHNLR